MQLLEFEFYLGGEKITVNEELREMLIKIMISYLKQKIGGVVPKEKKVKVPKDPKVKREKKPHLTPEEFALIVDRARQLSHLTMSKASTIIGKETGRAFSVIYTRLKNLKGTPNEIKFADFDFKHRKAIPPVPELPVESAPTW